MSEKNSNLVTKQEESKKIAQQIFDLFKDKEIDSQNIDVEILNDFNQLMLKVDGIETYVYEELGQLLNENYDTEKLREMGNFLEKSNDAKELPETQQLQQKAHHIVENNLKFARICGEYVKQYNFNLNFVDLMVDMSNDNNNQILARIIRQSNFDGLLQQNEYKNEKFQFYLWSASSIKNIFNFDQQKFKAEPDSYLSQGAYDSFIYFQVAKKDYYLDLDFIYKTILEKGWSIEDFFVRCDLMHLCVLYNPYDDYYSLNFVDDFKEKLKPLLDLQQMIIVVNVLEFLQKPHAKVLSKTIVDVYASLQSKTLSELERIDLKTLVGEKIDSDSSIEDKDSIKDFFVSDVFEKTVESLDTDINFIELKEYALTTFNEIDSTIFVDKVFKELKDFDSANSMIDKEICQLYQEIFNFVDIGDQKKALDLAKERFLRAPFYDVRKLNDLISLCNRFQETDKSEDVNKILNSTLSLRSWIIQKRNFRLISEQKYVKLAIQQHVLNFIPQNTRGRENLIRNLEKIEFLVCQNCSSDLYSKFISTIYKRRNSIFDVNQIEIIKMFKSVNRIKEFLEYISKNTENISMLVECLTSNPNLFLNQNFSWHTKARIAVAQKKLHSSKYEYKKYSVSRLINKEQMSSDEIAVAFELSSKTWWWNRSKNLLRLEKEINGQKGFKIIADVVSKLDKSQISQFYDWLYEKRDELITENGVAENLFERVLQNNFRVRDGSWENLMNESGLSEKQKEQFREFFKDENFRKVCQTPEAIKNMLIVMDAFNGTPVDYVNGCIKNELSLEILKTGFDKFNVSQIYQFYGKQLNVMRDDLKKISLFACFDGYTLFVNKLSKIENEFLTREKRDEILANSHICSIGLEDVLFNIFSFLKESETGFLVNNFSTLCSEDAVEFYEKNLVGGFISSDDIEIKGREYLKVHDSDLSRYDCVRVVFEAVPIYKRYFLNYSCLGYFSLVQPEIAANCLMVFDYGSENYNKAVENLDNSPDIKKQVESIVIAKKKDLIIETFGGNNGYDDFCNRIKSDKTRSIGRFINSKENILELYELLKLNLDPSKINGLDLNTIKAEIAKLNDESKIVELRNRFVQFANSNEPKCICKMFLFVGKVQKMLENEEITLDLASNEEVKAFAYAVDWIISVQPQEKQLQQYKMILEKFDESDIMNELKQQIKLFVEESKTYKLCKTVEDIVSQINEGNFEINQGQINFGVNMSCVSDLVAKKLLSSGKDAGDLADIVNSLERTGNNFAREIVLFLAEDKAVCQQLITDEKFKPLLDQINHSANLASQEIS